MIGERRYRCPATPLALLLTASMGLVLCSCGPTSRPLGELDFWTGFTGPDGDICQGIVEDFEHKSGLKVECQRIPWGSYFDKLMAAIAAGNPPDVFVLHVSELVCYVSTGAILPLDEYVDRDDSFVPKDDRISSIWKNCYYDGKLYGVPMDTHSLAIYYNKDLFKKAGIPELSRTEPITGNELIALAQALTRDDDGDGRPDVWGFCFGGWPRRYFNSLLWQFGGDLLSPDRKEARFDAPETERTLEWMTDLITKYHVCPPPEGLDIWQAFCEGRIAMMVDGSWMLNGLDMYAPFQYGAAPFFIAGDEPAVWADCHILCIPRNLPEERRPAALQLLKEYNDRGATWSYAGMIPTRHSQLSGADPRLEPFISELPHVAYEPSTPVGIELRDRYEAAVYSILFGHRSIEEGLKQGQARMTKVLRWYGD